MIVIVGPTSSGKTSLALTLCLKYNGEIISADSRQLYEKMDVGTGKIPITKATHTFEQKKDYWLIDGVKVYGYDLVLPDESFSASDFLSFYNKTKKKIIKNGKMPFLVGGTGFYIDIALGNKSVVGVEKDDVLREKLNLLSVSELKKLLPEDILSEMNNSDVNNPRRLIRKIEILNSTKEKKKKVVLVDENIKIVGLKADREVLYKRTDKWIESIWDRLVTETQYLILFGYKDTEPLNGLVYKTVKDYLSGVVDSFEAIKIIKGDLHGYIRRQETWFKKNKDIKWFDIESESFFADVEKFVA